MSLAPSTLSTYAPLQDAIQSVYNILVNLLCTKDIREELFAKEIIDMPIKETIQNKSNSKEANEALIDHLYKRGTVELVEKFIEVLRDTSSSYEVHEEVAQKLEGALRVHDVRVQSLSGQSESLLASFGNVVREKNMQLRVVPPDLTTKELMFVELAVVKSSEHLKKEKDVTNFLHAALEGIDKFYKQSESIRYEDVLSPVKQKSGRRIVISGAPGCGKTTLSRKYCKDLSSGTLPNDYQLVILCHLREVSWCLEENEQLTLRHFLPNCSRQFGEVAIIEKLEKSRGKGALLILDGYDEINDQMKNSKVMKNLLSSNSHYLDECDLIVSTRPFTCPEVIARMEYRCIHVEILGFTEKKINLFIDNYFSKSGVPHKEKMADHLKETLQSLPSVQGMCRLPVVLKVICKVQEYLKEKGLPHTMGGIYRLYIKRQLLQSSKGLKITNILEIPNHLLPGFSPLCQLSYNFSLTQKLVLSEEDLGEDLAKHVKRGSIYELLFAESADDFDAASPVQLYMFIHKTIQEALAAVHVAKQSKPEQGRIWSKQLGRPEMAEVWKFYCNFTKLCNIDVLPLLQGSVNSYQSAKMNELLMLSFFEADNEDLLKSYLPKIISNKLTFHISSAYETVVLQYTLQHHVGIRVLKITSTESVDSRFHLVLSTILSLQKLTELNISAIQLNGNYDFTVPERYLVSCRRLALESIKVTPKQLAALLKGIRKDQDMEKISLSSIDFVFDGESPCHSLGNVVKNRRVKQLIVTSNMKSLNVSVLGSLVSGVLKNRWIAEVDITFANSELTLAIPEECLVSCQKCYIVMSLTQKQRTVLINGIAKSKTMEQVKLDISTVKEGTSEVDPELYENLTSSLRRMYSLKRFAVINESLEYPLIRSLLLGALCNANTTDVYIGKRSYDYQQKNLFKDDTDAVFIQCTLDLTLTVHEWVNVFLSIKQSERLKQINVYGNISKESGTSKVDQELYENVTSSLRRMHSLKCFAVCIKSCEYPLIKSLLLGALCNANTTEVYVRDWSFDYRQKKLCKDDTDAVSIPSLKCTLRLTLTVHEWVNVFLSIKQSERLKQINVYGNISKESGTSKVDQELYENVTSSLRRMHSLECFAVCIKSCEYPLIKSLLLGALCNANTTEVYVSDWSFDYQHKNLCEDDTDAVSIPSLKCTLHMTLAVHEWMDMFLCIAQSEKLKEIEVNGYSSRRFMRTIKRDRELLENVTSSLRRMHSLKSFAVWIKSLEYPWFRSLLVGALCNANTTEVYISNGSFALPKLQCNKNGEVYIISEKLGGVISEGPSEIDPGLYENVASSLRRMHSLKRLLMFSEVMEYPLKRCLLLGALCNTSTTEVYITDNYLDYPHFQNLLEGITDVTSSLECRLRLKLKLHEWVDLFLCIAQSENLEQIKVDQEIREGISEVDTELYETLTSSINGMPSLKRFAMLSTSLEYPLMRTLLPGVLFNTSIREVYISDKIVDYKYFRNLWEDNPGVKPILSSLKCTLHLTLTVHQWVDVFLSIAQSERLEQIMVDGDIIEGHLPDYDPVDCKKLIQLKEALKQSNLKKVNIKLKSSFAYDKKMITPLATFLDGIATRLHSIDFKVTYLGITSSMDKLQSQMSVSSKHMFEWSWDECVLKPLETRQSLSSPPSRPLSIPKPTQKDGQVQLKQRPTILHQSISPNPKQSKITSSRIPVKSGSRILSKNNTPMVSPIQDHTLKTTPPSRRKPKISSRSSSASSRLRPPGYSHQKPRPQ